MLLRDFNEKEEVGKTFSQPSTGNENLYENNNDNGVMSGTLCHVKKILQPKLKCIQFVTNQKCTWTLTNSVALVRERTIPTERPQLVGEVSANFCG
jgi:hypothetical protein